MASGRHLKDRRIQDKDQANGWVAEYQAWLGGLESSISKAFSTADAKRFTMLNFNVDKRFPSFTGDQQMAICQLDAILTELNINFRDLMGDA